MSSRILACTDQGDGPPIVLLHGFPLSRRMWEEQVKAWSQNYRVIAPDFRGFGDSPIAPGEFSMAGCAQDLRDLLASFGIQKEIVLLGLSMGGYVCFEFVRRSQDMLRGLILVGTQPVGDSDASRQARYETAEFVRREGSSALAEKLIPRFLGKTTLADKPEVVETVRALIQIKLTRGDCPSLLRLGGASRFDLVPLRNQDPHVDNCWLGRRVDPFCSSRDDAA